MDSPAARALREAALAFAGQDPAGLPGDHVLANIEALVEVRDLLDGALAANLAAAEASAATVVEHGATTKAWLVSELRRPLGEAASWLAVAKALPLRPALAEALRAGEVSLAHAAQVAACLRHLPDELAAEIEPALVDTAREQSPSVVRRLTDELLQRAGAREAAAAAEQRRYDARFLQLDRTFHGGWAIAGMLDPLSGEALQAALAPLLGKTGPEDDRSLGQRRADALSWLAQHSLACGGLPDNGGERPQIVITMPLATLMAAVTAETGQRPGGGSLFGVSPHTTQLLTTDAPAGTATLGLTQTRIAAGQIRRLLCDAGILPAVLGGTSEILDLGRARRAWSAAQRRAARLRDGGCTFPGCYHGLDVCDLHHIVFWSNNGPTDLDNGTHLCQFHHSLVHTGRWRIHRDTTTGQITATGPAGQIRTSEPKAAA